MEKYITDIEELLHEAFEWERISSDVSSYNDAKWYLDGVLFMKDSFDKQTKVVVSAALDARVKRYTFENEDEAMKFSWLFLPLGWVITCYSQYQNSWERLAK